MDEEKLLKSFAKALGNEHLIEEMEQKKAKEAVLLEKMNVALNKLTNGERLQVEKAFEQPVPLIEDVPVGIPGFQSKAGEPPAIPLGAQPLPQLPHKDFVTRAVDALSQKPRDEYVAAVDEIPNSIRKELDVLKKTVTDLHRFSSRISQMGGGGEVNLRHLDDVNRSSIADGLYLRYDAATKKFVFDDPVSSPNLLNVASDIIPSTTLTYTIGNTTHRWDSLYVGSNSITFSDSLGGPDQVLSVANQVFYITQGAGTNTAYNANAGFNAGGIILQNYTIQLANTSQNLIVGSTSVNTSVIFNQNIKANTTITFTDNTVQNTAYKAPNVRIANVISNTVLIDFASDNFVHIHTNDGTVTANLQNLTAGKVVELFIFNNVGGTQQFNHGVSSTQATGGQSFYLCSHNTMYVKYFCLDGTANNTFVAAIT